MPVREYEIMRIAKTDSQKGTTIAGICKTLKKFGLEYDSRSMAVDYIRQSIDQKKPVLVLFQAWGEKKDEYEKSEQNKHWVVAIGYDEKKIIFEDPYVFERTFLLEEEFKARWHSEESGRKISLHGIAVFGKQPEYDSEKAVHME